MDEKNVIMKVVVIIACIFGYFFSSYLHVDIKIFLCIAGILAGLIYMVESIKNKNGRVYAIIGILSSLLSTALLSHFIIMYKFPEYDKYQNYILIFTIIIIVLACKIGGADYNKNSSKSEKRFMRILSIIIIICIVLIIIEILLKKCNVIP